MGCKNKNAASGFATLPRTLGIIEIRCRQRRKIQGLFLWLDSTCWCAWRNAVGRSRPNYFYTSMTKPFRYRGQWKDRQAHAKLDGEYTRAVQKTDKVLVAVKKQ